MILFKPYYIQNHHHTINIPQRNYSFMNQSYLTSLKLFTNFMQNKEDQRETPFQIIKNYRKKTKPIEKPHRKTSEIIYPTETKREIIKNPRKISMGDQTIILSQISPIENQETFDFNLQKRQEEQPFCLFKEDDLQNGIPLEYKDDYEMLYNMCDVSPGSQYQKLEKTLSGMLIQEEGIDFQDVSTFDK